MFYPQWGLETAAAYIPGRTGRRGGRAGLSWRSGDVAVHKIVAGLR